MSAMGMYIKRAVGVGRRISGGERWCACIFTYICTMEWRRGETDLGRREVAQDRAFRSDLFLLDMCACMHACTYACVQDRAFRCDARGRGMHARMYMHTRMHMHAPMYFMYVGMCTCAHHDGDEAGEERKLTRTMLRLDRIQLREALSKC